MNIVKFGIDLLLSKMKKQSVPYQVTLNLTNRCNLKCKYCYASYYDRERHDLTTEQWISIIKDLKKKGAVKINLSGGEPLLHKGIDEIIQTIVDNDMDCYVNTNGVLVPQKIELLKKIKCLVISLDGDKNSNDSMRGDGCFDKALKALEVAKANNIPLQIASVLGNHNLNQVDFLLDLSSKYGARLNIITQIPVRKDYEFIPLELAEDYYSVIKKVQKYKKEGRPITYSDKSWQNFLEWPKDIKKDLIFSNEMDLLPEGYNIECMAGKYFFVVDANGDMYPCCSVVDVIKPVNILKEGIDKAIENLTNHKCKACSLPHNTEMNLLFSMNPSIILNLLKIY